MVVARVPFSAAGVPPEFLTRDLSRQCAQLTALGWAGRIFRVAPWLLAVLGVKNAFELEPYKSDVAWRFEDGTTEITLGERSLVARGIPFRLRLEGGIGRQKVLQPVRQERALAVVDHRPRSQPMENIRTVSFHGRFRTHEGRHDPVSRVPAAGAECSPPGPGTQPQTHETGRPRGNDRFRYF